MNNTKLVNIRATTTVRNITPPILGVKTNIRMSTGDILNCLCRRAVVEEVHENGTYTRLNLSNYYTENDPAKGGPSCIVGNTVKAVNELKRPAAAPAPKKKEEPNAEKKVEKAAPPVEEKTPEPVAEEVAPKEEEAPAETVEETAPVAEAEAPADDSTETTETADSTKKKKSSKK